MRPNDLKREFPHLLYPGLPLLMAVFASVEGYCKAVARVGSIASRGFPYSFVLLEIRAAAGQPQAMALETVKTAVKEPQIFSKLCGLLLDRTSTNFGRVYFDE